MLSPGSDWNGQGPLKILVPGGINEAKGGMILKDLAQRFDKRVEFHLLGNIARRVMPAKNLINHGPYDRDDFVKRVEVITPAVRLGAIFSIWPETCCHTLTELWASGLPVIGINLGAVGERVSRTGAGWLADGSDPDEVARVIEGILSDPGVISPRKEAVQRWQTTIGQQQNTHWMSREYHKLYREHLPVLRDP